MPSQAHCLYGISGNEHHVLHADSFRLEGSRGSMAVVRASYFFAFLPEVIVIPPECSATSRKLRSCRGGFVVVILDIIIHLDKCIFGSLPADKACSMVNSSSFERYKE